MRRLQWLVRPGVLLTLLGLAVCVFLGIAYLRWRAGQLALAHLEAGRGHAAAGRENDALGEFDRALEANPYDAAALLERARLHHRRHRPELAQVDYEASLKRPASGETLAARVEVGIQLGSDLNRADCFRNAVKDATRGLAIDPDRADSYCRNRAEAHLGLDEDGDALKDANEAVSRKGDADSHYLRGRVRAKQGDDAAARADFDEAVRLAPGHAAAFAARAFLRLDQGDARGATADADRAIAVEPGSPAGYEARAHIAAAQRRWADALTDLDRAIERKPSEVGLRVARAILRYERLSPIQARSDVGKALQLNPSAPLALAVQAAFDSQCGRTTRADEAARAAAEAAPNDPAVQLVRAHVLADKGDIRAGLVALAGVAERTGRKDPGLCASIALMRLRVSDNAGAVKDLTRAVEWRPHAAEFWAMRGVAHARANDARAAAADFTEAERLDPPESLRRRGETLLELKDYAGAERAFSALLEASPDDEDALVGRAQASSAADRTKTALADLDRVLKSNPNNVTARRVRLACVADDKTVGRAEAACVALLALEPDDVFVHLVRASVQLDQERGNGALAEADKALKLEPNSAQAHGLRGVALAMLEQFTEAQAELERAGREDEAFAKLAREVQQLRREREEAANRQPNINFPGGFRQSGSPYSGFGSKTPDPPRPWKWPSLDAVGIWAGLALLAGLVAYLLGKRNARSGGI